MLKVYESLGELSRAAANYISELSSQAIKGHGLFAIALAGGSTPKKLYELLATEYKERIDWSKWLVFFSDERFVSLDDERSNYNLAKATLLSKVPIPREQIHPINSNAAAVELAAEEYEEEIKSVLPSGQFDLVLLGLGSDGHTASLFPGKPALQETEKLVVASTPGVLPPPVDRVTFTFPLINTAKNVAFLAAGADKTDMVKAATIGRDVPAAKVQPPTEPVWFIDKTAAGEI